MHEHVSEKSPLRFRFQLQKKTEPSPASTSSLAKQNQKKTELQHNEGVFTDTSSANATIICQRFVHLSYITLMKDNLVQKRLCFPQLAQEKQPSSTYRHATPGSDVTGTQNKVPDFIETDLKIQKIFFLHELCFYYYKIIIKLLHSYQSFNTMF